MNKRKVYITNLVIVAGFTLLCLVTDVKWLLLPAISVAVVSVMSFKGADFIAEKWMLLGKTLGAYKTTFLLTLTYFIVVVPTGLIRKLFKPGRREQHSNWKASKPLAANDFTRPF